MYSAHPEVFGDTATKGKHYLKSMKIHKTRHVPIALRQDEKVIKKPEPPQITTARSELALLPTPGIMPLPIQLAPMPMPLPIPVPMYPQMPVVLPMRTYFEPVIHHHPSLEKIRQIIKEDEERMAKGWEKSKAEKKEAIQKRKASEQTDSDSYDTDSDDYNRFKGWQYYDDFLHIKA